MGSGRSITIKQLVEMILEHLGLTGKTTVFYTGKSWEGDVTTLEANINLAQEILGYHPKVSLEIGLSKLINWFQLVERR